MLAVLAIKHGVVGNKLLLLYKNMHNGGNGMTQQVDHAREQAKAQLKSIVEMVQALRSTAEAYNSNDGDYEPYEDALETIREDALSVEVRTDWHAVGAEDSAPTHYRILLCTGGPACQIIGELTEHLEPKTARIEYQDWGTPWTNYPLSSDEEAIVLEYAQQFYYGE